jgi:hypothetical protein
MRMQYTDSVNRYGRQHQLIRKTLGRSSVS